MAFSLIETVGLYFAKKTINGAYNTTYNLLFGSDTYKINKKLDSIIEQNEILKKELFELKNNYSNKIIIYKDCELNLINNYIDKKNSNDYISKSMIVKSNNKKVIY